VHARPGPSDADALPVLFGAHSTASSGAADDWTPAWLCQRWVQQADSGGHTLKIEIYPNALHGFDTTAPLHVYAGHQVGGNPTASAAAQAEARAFLDARLGGN